jgi:hypothetical protein
VVVINLGTLTFTRGFGNSHKEDTKGHAIEIKACFTTATGEKSASTRCVFFVAEEIKPAQLRSTNERRAKTGDDPVIGGS